MAENVIMLLHNESCNHECRMRFCSPSLRARKCSEKYDQEYKIVSFESKCTLGYRQLRVFRDLYILLGSIEFEML